MVDEKLKALVEQIRAKSDELDKLVEKESHTAEDVVAMKALRDEVVALRGQLDQAGEVAKVRADLQGIKQFIETPITPAGVTVLGMKAAGETIVGAEKRQIEVAQIGEGQMEAKLLNAIRADGYGDAFQKYLRLPFGSLTNLEQKALQEGADTAGGYTVPEEWLARLIAKEPTPTRVAGRCTSVTTTRDSLALPRVAYPTDDLYTTGMRITWTGEVPAAATTHRVTDPVFGQIRVPVYTAMMSLAITNDLLEDSAIGLQAWVTGKFSETVDLLYDNIVLNGTGVGQPGGILLNPGAADQPATVASGAGAALTADGLLSLAWSLQEQYDENAGFVMNKVNTGQAIAKLKDGEGRYLWGLGLQDSGLSPSIRNRQLLGYDVTFSGFMPNVGVGTHPIIFGDLRGYYLVRRVAFSVQVLRELYAETNQILLLGRVRFGGAVAEPWRLKVQVVSA